MSTPDLSVVIICRNEAVYITSCLDRLAQTTRSGPLEIVVVDGCSTDGTAALVHDWAARHRAEVTARVIMAPKPGYGLQRNLGVAAATRSWVAFISADVRVGAGWLGDLTPWLDGPVDVVAGRFTLVTPAGRRPWLAALTPTIYPSRAGDWWPERCSTVHLIARREVLLAHPFAMQYAACEDKEWAIRVAAGNPRIVAVSPDQPRPEHLARETVGGFLRKLYRESVAVAALRRAYGRDLFGWPGQSRRALGALAACAAAVGTAVGLAAPGWAVAALIGCFVAGGLYPAGWRRRRAGFPHVALLPLHLAAVWCVTAGQLVGSRPAATEPGDAGRPVARLTRSGGGTS